MQLPTSDLRALAEHIGMSEKLSGSKSDMAYSVLWRLNTGGGVSLAGQTSLLGVRSKGLTAAQKAALTRWASTDLVPARINDGLRARKPITAEVARLDEAMAASHMSSDVTLYRGLNSLLGRDALAGLGLSGPLPDDLVGHEWTEPGFSATTQRRGIAETFSSGDGGVLLEIRVPAGTHAARIPGGEDEVLLDRGLRYRVVGDRIDTTMVGIRGDEPLHKRVLTVEVVPAGEAHQAQQSAENARKVSSLVEQVAQDLAGDLTEIGGTQHHPLDTAVYRRRIEAEAKRLGTPDDVRDALLAAIDTGDPQQIQAALDKAARDAGLTEITPAGSVARFDRKLHKAIGHIRDGAPVEAVRPGYDSAEGRISKAVVQEIDEAEYEAARLRGSGARSAAEEWDMAMTPEQRGRELALATRAAGHDVTPGHDELHHYWTKGPGLAKWVESPHQWTTLYHHLVKYVNPEMAKRMASAWLHEVTGEWAGSDIHRVHSGKPPRGHRIGPG